MSTWMNPVSQKAEADSNPWFVILPCAFYWLSLPVIVYEIRTSRLTRLPWSTLMSLKWFFASLLVVDRLFVFLLAVWEAVVETLDVPIGYFVYPLVHSITLIFILVATNEVRKAGIHSSGALFCTWMMFFLFSIPEFISWVGIGSNEEELINVDFFRYIAFLAYFPLVTIEFLLNFVSDPFSFATKNERCPEEDASFISRQLLSWFTRMITLGSKKPLETEDVFELDSKLDQQFLKSCWKKEWAAELRRNSTVLRKQRKNTDKTPLLTNNKNYGAVGEQKEDQNEREDEMPSLLRTLWILLRWELLGGSFIKFVSDLLNFSNPLLLNYLILFIETPDAPQWIGYALAVGLFVAGQLKSILLNNYFFIMARVGTKLQVMLTTAVYEKTLRLSNSARREKTTGEIVNLMAIDVDRFRMITPQIQQYWSSPLQIIVSMVILWRFVGVSVWAGVAVMVSIIPINFGISIWNKKLQMRLMKLKDERIRLTNEVLNGIKVVKLSAWEIAMEKAIEEIRAKELSMIRLSAFIKTISDVLNVAAPIFVAVITFTVFSLINPPNSLTPQIAFVSLTLFNMLRGPLMMAADLVAQTVQLIVSNKRLKSFLSAEEIDPTLIDTQIRGELYKNAVEVHSASFSWDKYGERFLKDIELTVETNELIAVVGSVGNGKSSLLMAILGEMEKQCGYVGVRGEVAYVPQQPWVLNQTFRQNIVMQSFFNQKLYDTVIDACALQDDLKQLPSGEDTEIGEKGINVSGGQKARIALARAVYQNKNVYLLDDPLSAVDAHVGKHIFEKVIGPNGILNNTTRIFVTNCTSFLKEADRIAVINNGRITHIDEYDNLMSNEETRRFLISADEDTDENSEQKSTEESEKETLSEVSKISRHSEKSAAKRKKSSVVRAKKSVPAKLIQKEEAQSGRVKFEVYWTYFKAMGIFRYVLPYLLATAIQSSLTMARSLWLTNWSDENLDPNPANHLSLIVRIIVYATMGLLETTVLYIALVSLLVGGVAASKNLHRPLLHNILRSPLSHFDVTPIGRILNRLAKDMEVVDLRLSGNFRFLVISFVSMLQAVILITYSTPLFILVVIPVFIMYILILKHCIKSTRQLQRLGSLTRSPIFSNFSETIQGISTIRAFGWGSEFVQRHDRHLNLYVRCSYYSQIASRWLSIRLELLGNVVILAAAVLAIIAKNWGEMTAGGIGLSVSYSLNITFMLNMFVRQLNEVETNVVSVERIDEYTKTRSEAVWRLNSDRLPPKWPANGDLYLENYSTKYRDELELVLHGITLNVIPGQKVGVCGRTGAGKSSLALALFRIVEPTEGKIQIDGVDVNQIGLYDLRERITIIPQENVLFANTLRFNLDPTNQYSDNQLWKALESSNLKEFVRSLPKGLEHKVAEGGENLSMGQRQLFCLARALLRKSKILVLDEATAGIDNQTDALVQETIRREFSDSTIITIAHRLNTILDYNRIIVMDKGKIIEDGIPGELLKDRNSKFYGLAKSSNIV
ncbi:unnamed protein product [Caenorhabditis auriculariae]|uniref:ABC-type glutathione-S-conjugate transporter n=1 Tax=Caenorhabditis auriculariae TaxID=2777116 RepID=A0A8S1H0A5_9PELO|nr:unnamed protein product [Caenorhabditis auriculariae]